MHQVFAPFKTAHGTTHRCILTTNDLQVAIRCAQNHRVGALYIDNSDPQPGALVAGEYFQFDGVAVSREVWYAGYKAWVSARATKK